MAYVSMESSSNCVDLGFLASVALLIWASKPITTALPFAVLKKKKPSSSSSIASLSESSPKPEISTLGC